MRTFWHFSTSSHIRGPRTEIECVDEADTDTETEENEEAMVDSDESEDIEETVVSMLSSLTPNVSITSMASGIPNCFLSFLQILFREQARLSVGHERVAPYGDTVITAVIFRGCVDVNE